MHPDNKEKIAFIIENANFYYWVMSFGLKDVGATYQRLMNKVFAKQIDRKIEVYIDNMVAKTSESQGHYSDLFEIFSQLQQHNMRLNPNKCAFGVQANKFLGFMLTNQGIEANPKKCKLILEIRSHANMKEVW